MVLNLDIISQDSPGPDENILTDDAILPNPGTRHDVGEVPDFCPLTNLHTFIYNSRRMNKVSLLNLIHLTPTLPSQRLCHN
jgi:hypothetical protein